MSLALLLALTLGSAPVTAGQALSRPPAESSLLVVIIGEPDFEFDLVYVEGGRLDDPEVPSAVGADGMRLLACEELVAGLEHWTGLADIACTDGYSMEELKRLLRTSDPADLPEAFAAADCLLLVQDLEVSLRGFFIGTDHTFENYRERLLARCHHTFWDRQAQAAVHKGQDEVNRFGKPPNLIQRVAGTVWERLDWRDAMDPLARDIARGSPFFEKQKVKVDDRYKGLD